MEIKTKFDFNQQVFFLYELNNEIHKGIISGFTMFAEFETPLWQIKDLTKFGYIDVNEDRIYATREEAEEKLKEPQN